jgi:hypothetical protein
MRVFACYVVSKLQRHRCPTFGALRLQTRHVQTGRYIFIYIDISNILETMATVQYTIHKSIEIQSDRSLLKCQKNILLPF